MDNRPIGVFDSGVGGLTVTKEIMSQLKNETVVYFGDTARLPYGGKSKEIITKFSFQDVRFLLSRNVKAIVIACNTASANSFDEIKENFDIPVFGVVTPGAKAAARETKNGRVGIIATTGTVRSGAYEKAIFEIDKDIKVFSKACPLFVPLVEEGWTDNEITYMTAEKYISCLTDEGVDSIVMGCTHYPLLQKCLQRVAGEKVTLINPAQETVKDVKEFLKRNDMLREDSERPEHSFFVSDITDMFGKICKEALGDRFLANKIDIERY
ncbi:MAG: glutamate racemase [Firmicutes bacterium]|nr:glutamate racemase [Bacillota bacterium]